MRKVLRAQAQKAPHLIIHWCERELMRKILILTAQFFEIVIGNSLVSVSLWHGVDIEQTSLSHKHSLNLKQVVAVLANGRKGHTLCPLLKGIAINAKTIVAGKGNKIGIFPGSATLSNPLLYGNGLLLQAFCLQSTHPRVNSKLRQLWHYLITWRIRIGAQEFLIVVCHLLRHTHNYLWYYLACG